MRTLANDVSMTVATPFLTLEQAAGELKTTKVHILRLIARGALSAVQAGDSFKIRPADLDAYARKGSPDFDAPRFDQHGAWIEEHDLRGFAKRFQERVRDVIRDSFLTSVPRDGRGQIMRLVNVPVAGALRQLVNAPPLKSSVRISGSDNTPSPYRRAAEQYAASEMRDMLRRTIKRETSSKNVTLDGGTDLTRLYASPEEYGRLTRAAAEKFNANSISLGKEYSVPQRGGMPVNVRVNYRVRHADLGVDTGRVLQLAL